MVEQYAERNFYGISYRSCSGPAWKPIGCEPSSETCGGGGCIENVWEWGFVDCVVMLRWRPSASDAVLVGTGEGEGAFEYA